VGPYAKLTLGCSGATQCKVQIQILNVSVAWCSDIGHFRSHDAWVSAGAVVGRCPSGTHHADMVGLDVRVLVDAAPDLRVVFNGILIMGCFRR
jgi:hypothetical protein